MKRNPSLEQVLLQLNNKTIKRIVQSPLKGYLIIFTGFVVFLLSEQLEHTHFQLIAAILILFSVAVMLWGSIDTFILNVNYQDVETGEFIQFDEYYFNPNEFGSLQEILQLRNFDALELLHKSRRFGCKLRLAHNSDWSVCFVQAVKYIQFDFAQRSKAVSLDIHESALINKYLNINTEEMQQSEILL